MTYCGHVGEGKAVVSVGGGGGVFLEERASDVSEEGWMEITSAMVKNFQQTTLLSQF